MPRNRGRKTWPRGVRLIAGCHRAAQGRAFQRGHPSIVAKFDRRFQCASTSANWGCMRTFGNERSRLPTPVGRHIVRPTGLRSINTQVLMDSSGDVGTCDTPPRHLHIRLSRQNAPEMAAITAILGSRSHSKAGVLSRGSSFGADISSAILLPQSWHADCACLDRARPGQHGKPLFLAIKINHGIRLP